MQLVIDYPEARLRVASNRCVDWQVVKWARGARTSRQGLCPENEVPPALRVVIFCRRLLFCGGGGLLESKRRCLRKAEGEMPVFFLKMLKNKIRRKKPICSRFRQSNIPHGKGGFWQILSCGWGRTDAAFRRNVFQIFDKRTILKRTIWPLSHRYRFFHKWRCRGNLWFLWRVAKPSACDFRDIPFRKGRGGYRPKYAARGSRANYCWAWFLRGGRCCGVCRCILFRWPRDCRTNQVPLHNLPSNRRKNWPTPIWKDLWGRDNSSFYCRKAEVRYPANEVGGGCRCIRVYLFLVRIHKYAVRTAIPGDIVFRGRRCYARFGDDKGNVGIGTKYELFVFRIFSAEDKTVGSGITDFRHKFDSNPHVFDSFWYGDSLQLKL